jgi:hypothetical protein
MEAISSGATRSDITKNSSQAKSLERMFVSTVACHLYRKLQPYVDWETMQCNLRRGPEASYSITIC